MRSDDGVDDSGVQTEGKHDPLIYEGVEELGADQIDPESLSYMSMHVMMYRVICWVWNEDRLDSVVKRRQEDTLLVSIVCLLLSDAKNI